jgi:hypothetical protein
MYIYREVCYNVAAFIHLFADLGEGKIKYYIYVLNIFGKQLLILLSFV